MLPTGRKSSISTQYASRFERMSPPAKVRESMPLVVCIATCSPPRRTRTSGKRPRNVAPSTRSNPASPSWNRAMFDISSAKRAPFDTDRTEAAVASTRGVGLAGGARQQEQDPRGGRLPIALLDATAESDDLGPMEGFVGVREHRPARDGRVWLHPIVSAEVEMADHGGVPRSVRETTLDELPQSPVRKVIP